MTADPTAGSADSGLADSGLADAAFADRVFAGLDAEQAEAVRAVTGPVCILAGAGTGKTRTITHRIAYAVHTGAAPAGRILAVTFTSRAAGEMRTRLRTLGVGGVQARTFHAAALRQLRHFAPRVLGGPMPELVENKLRLVATAAARCRVQTDRTLLRDLASEIEWAKASVIGPETYLTRAGASARTPPVAASTMAEVYAAYEEVKAGAGVLDFDDLLLVSAAAIEEHRDVADEVRARYRHFVVDEYQDVSPLQQRLLEAWLGGRHDVCVVGDANQTIYSFAGAEPGYLTGFARAHAGTTVVRLERDYRSTPEVVGLANAVVAGGDTPAGARLRLVGQRPRGPAPKFAEHDDEPAEAAAVAASAQRLVRSGVPAGEIAVLFRVNAQSEAYERAFTDAGLPYVLRGGERFFARPEVRQAMVLLRGGARTAEPDRSLVDSARDVLAAMGWSADAPPGGGGAARERWESLAALVQVAEEHAAVDPDAGLRELAAELEQRAEAQHAPAVQGVTLASLHAAKGLEWDAVFLVGLVDGTLPIQHASTDVAIAEERRLLYVGITRARVHLCLSWSLARSPGGRRSRRPSRFLDGVRGDVGGKRADSGLARRGGRKDSTGRGSERERLEGADVEVFDRLRAWRAAQASEAKVPAYVVFSDATLVAIAQARPADMPALAAVAGVGPTKLARYGADVLAILTR